MCLCMDNTFFTQATGCTTMQCGVKPGLCESCCPLLLLISRLIANPTAATNLTMSTCQVPQADQSRVAPILAGVLGMLALIMVSLRLIQRSFFSRLVGWDDGLIVAALICAAPLNCAMFPSKWKLAHTSRLVAYCDTVQKYGLGTNIWTIPFAHITKQLEVRRTQWMTPYSTKLTVIVALRCRSLLHARRSLDSNFFSGLLPAHLPVREIPPHRLRADDLFGMFRHLKHLRHDLPVYTGLVLLVWVDRGIPRKLYRHQHLLVVQSCNADRDGPVDSQSPDLAPAPLVSQYQEEDSDCVDVLHGIFVRSSPFQLGESSRADQIPGLPSSVVCACSPW